MKSGWNLMKLMNILKMRMKNRVYVSILLFYIMEEYYAVAWNMENRFLYKQTK